MVLVFPRVAEQAWTACAQETRRLDAQTVPTALVVESLRIAQ